MRPNPRLAWCLALGLMLGVAPARSGERADEGLPEAHWIRTLAAGLPFPPEARPPPRLATRWDAAVHLARWLERGAPAPLSASPVLLARELEPELVTLGLEPAACAAKLRARGARTAVAPVSLGAARTFDHLDESLRRLAELDARLAGLSWQAAPEGSGR